MRAAAFALVALACGAAKVGSRPAAMGVRWAPRVATALDAAAMAAGQQDLPQQPEDASGHAAPGATPDSACSVSQSGNVPADLSTAQAPQCQANGTRSCRTISPPSRGAAFDFASSPWKSPPGRSPDADLPYEFRLPPGPFDVLEDDGPGACADDEHFVGSPAFDDSDVLTESDFNLFDADHTSQDAL